MTKININNCARCGCNHINLLFKEFINPIFLPITKNKSADFTHWATCPNTEEPIIMKIEFHNT